MLKEGRERERMGIVELTVSPTLLEWGSNNWPREDFKSSFRCKTCWITGFLQNLDAEWTFYLWVKTGTREGSNREREREPFLGPWISWLERKVNVREKWPLSVFVYDPPEIVAKHWFEQFLRGKKVLSWNVNFLIIFSTMSFAAPVSFPFSSSPFLHCCTGYVILSKALTEET